MLKPRQEVFDTYWKFAAERQAIFERRAAGAPSPWTTDPVLRHFKFCNTFRINDRVSQYLVRKVIYGPSHLTPEDQIFRTIFFRLFNRNETWSLLESETGPVSLSNFQPSRISIILRRQLEQGERIFGGAFILCANKVFGYARKHDNYLALLERMSKDELPARILEANSLKRIYQLLLDYPLIGKFMAYQITIDLNYTPVLDYCENSFTVAGPGANRGVKKCFISRGGLTDEEIINWMVDHQDEQFSRLGLDFRGLHGRPLHAIDCQGLFCEVDKYSRVAFPELKSSRRRIKAVFQPSRERIDYFYPPKWTLKA